MTIKPPEAINLSSQLVNTVLTQSQTMAASSASSGASAIDSLSNFDVLIPPVSVPNITVPVIAMPATATPPSDPGNLDTVLPMLPNEPIQATLPPLDLPEVPNDTLHPPFLLDIPLPDPFDALLPAAPILGATPLPIEPDFTLPDVPTLIALNLPSAPTLDIPLFAADAPLLPPALDAEFAWSEVAYESAQLADLNGRLLSLVQGTSSALAPDVEDALYQKVADAEAWQTHDAVQQALQLSAARGFILPGGPLVRIVQQAIVASQDKSAEASRQLMLEQAQLEQSNFQFAFNAAMQLEARLMAQHNAVQQRALEAARYRVQAMTDLFNARVSLFEADVRAFGVKVDVFRTRLQGALSRLELYKTQLEGARLTGELNAQLTQQYAAQIKGVVEFAEIFRVRVEAASLTVATNKNRTDLYREQIQGYAAKVKAATLATEGYVAQIQGEKAKAEIFGQQVAAYTSRVDAYRILTEAKLSEATLTFRQEQEFPVELYKGRIAAYQATVSAEAQRLTASATVFSARVEAFAATERVAATHAAAQADAAKTTVQLYTSRAQASMQAAAINMKLALNKEETAQAGLRAKGQLNAQLAAAAMSARNVSASLSGTVGNSVSESTASGKSFSRNKATSMTNSSGNNYSSSTGQHFTAAASLNTSESVSEHQTVSYSNNNAVSNSTTKSVSNDTSVAQRVSKNSSLHTGGSVSHQTIYTHKA